MITRVARGIYRKTHPYWPFLEEDALAINTARMEHLASLDLDLEGRSVLEVGAGIGLLTSFFEERHCDVLSTDARPANVREITRRHPSRRVAVADLDRPDTIGRLGRFDVVFCYGTLYHLASPEAALQALASISQVILLETVVSRGDEDVSPQVDESVSVNQAAHLVGSRPTRRWVLNRLRRLWGHGYITTSQPNHPDFPTDWNGRPSGRLTRAVFIGSTSPISNPLLMEEIPAVQRAAR